MKRLNGRERTRERERKREKEREREREKVRHLNKIKLSGFVFINSIHHFLYKTTKTRIG